MENNSERELLSKLLHLYRVQRHDFLNHFQVAMGYIQMGKNQTGLEYLKQAAAESMDKAVLARVNPPELATELMCLEYECFKQGVPFKARAKETLPAINWDPSYTEALRLLTQKVVNSSRLELELAPCGESIGMKVLFESAGRDLLEELKGTDIALYEGEPAKPGSLVFTITFG